MKYDNENLMNIIRLIPEIPTRNASQYRKGINILIKNGIEKEIIDNLENERDKKYLKDICNLDEYFLAEQKSMFCDSIFNLSYTEVFNMLNTILDFFDSVRYDFNSEQKDKYILLNEVYECLTRTEDDKYLKDVYIAIKNKKIDMKSILYSFYDLAKSISYDLLIKSLIKKEELEFSYDKSKGINVYELSGEQFYLLVHKTDSLKKEYWDSNVKKEVSLSLISNISMHKMWECGKYILVFDNIPKGNILLTSTQDLDINFKQNTNLDIKQNFLSPLNFILQTKYHNEVRVENPPYPSFVLCYDSIDDSTLYAAKELGIDIIRINQKNYNYGDISNKNLG